MQTFLTKPEIVYHSEAYNKFDDHVQYIRISDGCPNGCPFCYAPKRLIQYPIPPIIRSSVKIMDMNLLAQPGAKNILNELGKEKAKYELICGIDYRIMDPEFADLLKKNHFIKIRLAWDFSYSQQKRIKDVVNMLLNAGYKTRDITIFMICNWDISYIECLKKMDLLKIWNIKIADCYFDNQISPNINPIGWTQEQIKDFRMRSRKHNQLVNFKMDPEI